MGWHTLAVWNDRAVSCKRSPTIFICRDMRLCFLKFFLYCPYASVKLESLKEHGECPKRRRPSSSSPFFILLSDVCWGCEASSINLADNRSFLAVSTGLKTSDRSCDLFAWVRLDRRLLPISLGYVGLAQRQCTLYIEWIILQWRHVVGCLFGGKPVRGLNMFR